MIESLLGLLKSLLGFLFKSHAASQAQSRDHDVALFRKADATVNEVFVSDLLNADLYNRWCRVPDIRALRHFCDDYRREENQFLDQKVAKAALAAVEHLDAVDSFVGRHFFSVREMNDDIIRLYPELKNADDAVGRDRYRQRAEELTELTAAAWAAYREYRATVKRRLKV